MDMYIYIFSSVILSKMMASTLLRERGRIVYVVRMALNNFALASCNDHFLIGDARDHAMVCVWVISLVGVDDDDFLVNREVPGIVDLKLVASKPARGVSFVQVKLSNGMI